MPLFRVNRAELIEASDELEAFMISDAYKSCEQSPGDYCESVNGLVLTLATVVEKVTVQVENAENGRDSIAW